MELLQAVFTYIKAMLEIVGGVLTLQPDLYAKAYEYQGSLFGLPIAIVVVGGISLMLGQSVVLFANRVSTVRFWVSILLGAFRFFLNVLGAALIIWIVVNLLSAESWPMNNTMRAVSLAYAPYWLGILILIPYLGLGVERGLKVYVFLTLTIACQSIFHTTFWWGVFGAMLAVLSGVGFDMLISRPLTTLVDRIAARFAGRQGQRSVRELYDEFARRNTVD